jgi:hypothetical protein
MNFEESESSLDNNNLIKENEKLSNMIKDFKEIKLSDKNNNNKIKIENYQSNIEKLISCSSTNQQNITIFSICKSLQIKNEIFKTLKDKKLFSIREIIQDKNIFNIKINNDVKIFKNCDTKFERYIPIFSDTQNIKIKFNLEDSKKEKEKNIRYEKEKDEILKKMKIDSKINKIINFFEWELINIEEDIGDLIIYDLDDINLNIAIFKKNLQKNGNFNFLFFQIFQKKKKFKIKNKILHF